MLKTHAAATEEADTIDRGGSDSSGALRLLIGDARGVLASHRLQKPRQIFLIHAATFSGWHLPLSGALGRHPGAQFFLFQLSSMVLSRILRLIMDISSVDKSRSAESTEIPCH
jgi:hypothetical protein